MKVLFSNPPWWAMGENNQLRAGIRAGSRWPFTAPTNSRPDAPASGEYMPWPAFLGFAASWCQRAFPNAQVVLRDSIARRESYQTFLNYVRDFAPDFVVIETATPSWAHDMQICRLIRDVHPFVKIIITGTITTTRAKEITDLGYWAIQGEYEKGVVRAIAEWETNYTNPHGNLLVGHDMLTQEEMNAAPIPMYDEQVALAYYDACPSGQTAPELVLWSTRGCTFRCCFCAWPAVMTNNDPDGAGKRKVRFYTPEYVEAWARQRIAQNPGIASIRLDDDTMNFGDKHTIAISEAMGRTGLPWSAMCRADTIKSETWAIMKANGCFGVKIGMESGSQRVIDGIINKKLDLADIEARILPQIKAAGLHVHTTWTIGLPGETPAEANETLRMIERLYAKGLHQTHQLSGTATIEGTPMDKIAQGEKLTAYPAASNDGLLITGDGQAKVEHIARAQLK